MYQLPRVAVTVLINKDGKFLLGKRKGNYDGAELHQTPGGLLEIGESVIECGVRETREETGLEIKNPRFACTVNVTQFMPRHVVLVCLIADWAGGEPKNLEEDKCHGWNWYHMNDLPAPLTPATAGVIEAYNSGIGFFDSGKKIKG